MGPSGGTAADRVNGLRLCLLPSGEGDGSTVFLLRGYPSSSLDYGVVVLIAHDMGTLVATELLARDLLGPVVARFANRRMFTRCFARLFTDSHPLSAEKATAQWALMSYNDGQRIAHLLISYLDERVR